MPVETSFCIAMLTLWLMPMSSVRMISETAEVLGVAVWADTSDALVNVTQPAMAIARGRCKDGGPRWHNGLERATKA